MLRPGPPTEVLAGAPRWTSRVSSWRGGRLLAADVPKISGRITARADDEVPETITLTVPRLAAPADGEDWFDWSPGSDPLHPLARFGQQLDVTIIVESEITGQVWETRVGRFLIKEWDDDDAGLITVKGEGLLALPRDDKLSAPLSPVGTFMSEARRLAPAGMGVSFAPGLVDRPCPPSMSWADGRLDALREIAAAWPALLRTDEWGQITFTLPLPAVATPELTIRDGGTGRLVATDPVYSVDAIENLAPYPSFERAEAGTTVVRKNLAPGRAPWSTVVASGVSYAGRGDWSRIAGARIHAPLTDLVNGEVYTSSVLVANDSTETRYAYLIWSDAIQVIHQIAPGEVKRISVTGARATYDSIYRFFGVTVPNGKNLLFTEPLIEQGIHVKPHFAHDTPSNLGIAYSWAGTAGASAMIARAAVVEVRKNWHPQTWNSSPASTDVAPRTPGRPVWKLTPGAPAYSGESVGIQALPGEQGTASIWVYCPTAMRVQLATDQIGNDTRTIPAGVWTYLEISGTLTGTGYTAVPFYLRTPDANQPAFYMTEPMYEKTLARGMPFFSSTYSPDPDLTPAASGALGVLYGVALPAVVGLWRGVWVRSWAGGARLIQSEHGATLLLAFALTPGSLRPGVQYTILSTIENRTGMALTRLRPGLIDGDTVVHETPLGIDETKTFRFQVTSTVQPTWLGFGVEQAVPLGRGIRVLRAMIVEGVYDGPFFDGDSAGSELVVYRWSGTRHASTSLEETRTLVVPSRMEWVEEHTDSLLIRAPRADTRKGAYNRVIVSSSATDREDVVGVAEATAGEMSVSGPYGVVTRRWSSPLLETEEQAAAAAGTMLANSVRSAQTVPARIVPDPRIVLDLPVALLRGSSAPVWGWVTGYDLPLTADGGEMSVEVGVPT
jgi:hypothetical protein